MQILVETWLSWLVLLSQFHFWSPIAFTRYLAETSYIPSFRICIYYFYSYRIMKKLLLFQYSFLSYFLAHKWWNRSYFFYLYPKSHFDLCLKNYFSIYYLTLLVYIPRHWFLYHIPLDLQVFQPWVQKRRLDYIKHRHVMSGILKHLKKHALGRLCTEEGRPNVEVLSK